MKKILSLIKVSLNHDMNIFKIHTKKQSNFSKYFLPLIITLYIMVVFGFYAKEIINFLKPVHLEFVVLTLFALVVSIFTLIEGIYKSGNLLFNCKDDQLLLSLPVKKSTVLLIRILKFYVFELLFNTLFFLPVIIVYAFIMHPGFTFYLSSFFALLLLPIVPIILSCLIGFVISFLSSQFKGKNISQTIFTMLFLLIVMYLSYNMDGFIENIAAKASGINDFITRLYYPVGAYISLINDFNIMTLIIYLLSHILLAFVTVFILSKFYFKINSSVKKVLVKHNNNHYIIKSNSKMHAFIKKELNRFISTPVFAINAGFGLILYVIACIMASIKYDSIIQNFINISPEININYINSLLPILMFGLVCFASLMTSITSSMISLEGKSFSILKSIPIKPIEIVLYKVISALVIMVPFILIGDIIIFIKFKFDLINMLLLLITSIIIPFVSELIGIIVNLKYPKLDATNDTEVVKQSMSSMISVFIGIGLLTITGIGLFKMITANITNHIIILLFISFYSIIALLLWLLLYKKCDRLFNNIEI